MKYKIIILNIALIFAMSVFSVLPVKAVDELSQTGANTRQKSELSHVLKKFAISMGLVGGSCLILYIALNTYKRFKDQENNTETYLVDVTKDLTTPETIDEATKFFIEKF